MNTKTNKSQSQYYKTFVNLSKEYFTKSINNSPVSSYITNDFYFFKKFFDFKLNTDNFNTLEVKNVSFKSDNLSNSKLYFKKVNSEIFNKFSVNNLIEVFLKDLRIISLNDNCAVLEHYGRSIGITGGVIRIEFLNSHGKKLFEYIISQYDNIKLS